MIGSMQLSSTLSWLVDVAGETPGADRLLAEVGARLVADGLPLAGGALTVAVPHPLIARRTWIWRTESGEVIEALGFVPAGRAATEAASAPGDAGRRWLTELAPGVVHKDTIGTRPEGPSLAWIGPRAFTPDEAEALHQAARFAAAPLAAVAARATLTAALEAYLGRRSAARVLAGPLRRNVGARCLVRSHRRPGPRLRRRGPEIHRRRRAGDFPGGRRLAAQRLRRRAPCGRRRAGRNVASRRCATSRGAAAAAVRRGAASRRDALGQYRCGRPAGFHRDRPGRQSGQPAGGALPAARQGRPGLGHIRRRDRSIADTARNACAARYCVSLRRLHRGGKLSRLFLRRSCWLRVDSGSER